MSIRASSHRKIINLQAFMACLLASMVAGAIVAAPAVAHWGFAESFGSGRLSNPVGLAIDHSNSDVFVGNLLFVGNDKYDSSHNLLSPPSPFGEGSGLYSGIAVNPVNHDVYVVDAEAQSVQTYDPSSGKKLSEFPVAGSANLFGAYTVVQIAADSAGNVYVPNAPNNEVQEFDSAGNLLRSIAGSGTNALKEPVGVAVDSAGNIWVADTGDSRIEEFDSAGTFVREIASEGVRDVAVDSAGDVFASVFDGSGAHVREYAPAGVQIDDFGLGTLGDSFFESPNSVAINDALGVVYVADGGKNVVWAFTQWGASTGSPSNGSPTGATLNGTVTVDPSEPPIISCQFEYIDASEYQKAIEESALNPYGGGQVAPCSQPIPYSSTTDVSADISGLTPGTDYHFRLTATNEDGVTSQGDDHAFGPPSIDSESSQAQVKDATLRAQINPFGYDTTCRVQYVDEAGFQGSGYANATTLSCTPADLGSGVGDESPSATLSGLQIDTTYHFRFVATNQAGTTTGADQTFATFGIKSFAFAVIDQGDQPYTQAGGHPYELTTSFALNTTTDPRSIGAVGPTPEATDANPKDVHTELPPGLIGNPQATPKCKPYNVALSNCAGATQVGLLTVYTSNNLPQGSTSPLYNLVPPAGLAAQFGARFNGFVTAYIDSKVRSGADYGVTSDALNIAAGEGVIGASVTLWGVPAEPSHDAERSCSIDSRIVSPCSSDASHVPFLTNPTSCTGPQQASMSVDSWQAIGDFVTAVASLPATTGCERLSFTPSLSVKPETSVAESPTGLSVKLHIPQIESPTGLAEADLRDAVVTLPRGLAVNPSSANGLEGCSDAQIGYLPERSAPTSLRFTPDPASCPDASKIGSVEVDTPLLDHPLKGDVYVARQAENPFGSLLAIYIAVHDPQSGVVLKLAGKVSPDPETGQLTTTFDENPQLPFEDLKLELFGGPRAALATPAACGTYTTTSSLTPWSAPESGPPAAPSDPFTISSGCASSFAPSFTAGTTSNQAGGFSSFTLTLARNDGEQKLSTVAVKTPPGIAGMIASVPLCGEAEANAGTCPASSRIGTASVAAGAGPDPLWLSGSVYLTGPYEGAPFGLSIVVPAIAGPFNLGNVVVRSKIEVDPHTAQVTVTSDPLPQMVNTSLGDSGIPTDVRTVNVTIDRPSFIFNPTSCEAMKVDGTLTSTQGAQAVATSRFQSAGCAALSFKPGFAAFTEAHHSRATGESLHVVVTSGSGQANVARVHVALPKRLPSRLATLKLACSAQQFAANPAGCPSGSFVGTATAHTPVLPVPMTGPAIFVSHGGAAFPDLDIVLQGDGVTVILTGNTFIAKGVTESTFASVPDVPVSRFDLILPRGPHSALSAQGNLCYRTVAKRSRVKVRMRRRVVYRVRKTRRKVGVKLIMPTTITGQNGAVATQNTKIAVSGCAKSKRHNSNRHHA